MLAAPKSGALAPALGSQANAQTIAALQARIPEVMTAEFGPAAPLLTLLLETLRSPLEVDLVGEGPQPMEAEIVIEGRFAFESVDALNALLSDVTEPGGLLQLLQPASDDQPEQILAGVFPIFYAFDPVTQRVRLVGGMAAQPESFGRSRSWPENPESPMRGFHDRIDAGSHGLFVRADVTRLTPLMQQTLPPDEIEELDGNAFLGGRARNLLFANNNIVTAGNRNSWGFRISGGDNILIVDNGVRVSFHKLVRMNDDPVDYVYIKGGTWMRELTLTSGGLLLNDSFAQLSGSTTDRIYIHDPAVYLIPDAPVTFGASGDAGQSGRSWEACGIAWHSVHPDVISESRLDNLQGFCTSVGGLCNFGLGTHSYHYNPDLEFPADPWRNLPKFRNNDPDALPVLP